MELWYFTVGYLAEKAENESCIMYCICYDCHITCLVCQWLQNMRECVFGKENCQILDKGKLVAVAVKVGKLYYLKCRINGVYIMCGVYGETKVKKLKEEKWHQRFGHLSERNMQKLSK